MEGGGKVGEDGKSLCYTQLRVSICVSFWREFCSERIFVIFVVVGGGVGVGKTKNPSATSTCMCSVQV